MKNENMFFLGKERALHILNREYEEFIHTLALGEGSTMTLAQTIATLSDLPISNARPRDIILVKNIQMGYDFVLDLLKENKFYFEKDIFCRINRYVAAHDNHDNIGNFRNYGIKIVGSKNRGVNPQKLDETFFDLKERYLIDNSYDELNLFLDLSKVQFFGDGNKRTSQLVMNALLVNKGYCPFIVNFREEIFSEKLVAFYDNNNLDIYNLMLDKQQEILEPYLLDEELEKISNKNNKINKKINNKDSNLER